ncbi:radical SAM protein [Candidatus Poribacteria bacterium]|nr:radical SAM protein [Candidatus Poribacteria bacterium]
MKKFKKIYIEITNVCNLNCEFCPKTSRKPEFMKIDLFKKILSEIKNHTNYLYFHVMGEPLLHPDIDVFLDLCHESDFKVNITTNGVILNTVKNKILNKPALRLINFSLHSFDANSVNNTIDEYLEEIFNFITEATKNTNLIICFRLWDIDKYEYKNSLQYILQKIEKNYNTSLEKQILQSFHSLRMTCNGGCHSERNEESRFKINKTAYEYGVKIKNNIYISQASRFEWPDNKIPEINNKGFCYGLRNQAAILVNGTVVPCCLDSEGTINLGNINTDAFAEIINSKKAVNLYEGFSKRHVVESLCKKCGYRQRFNL